MSKWILVVTMLLALANNSIARQAQHFEPDKAKELNIELFIAIRTHDFTAEKQILAKGADVHMRNWLNMTPLMFASIIGDRKSVDILLNAGARLDDGGIYDTAATMAANSLHGDLAVYLMSRGAKWNGVRVDGMDMLMIAANNGQTDLMDTLLKRGAKVNVADRDGATPLIYAARMGQVESARRLINKGAAVDIADSHGRTPLMYASMNGNSEVVDLLLRSHSGVNLKDRKGATPLLLNARYSGESAIVRSLIRAGADCNVRDSSGKSAATLASSRGYMEAAQILQAQSKLSGKQAAIETPLSIKLAVQDSVVMLQTGVKVFNEKTPCVSCHHQGLGVMALGMALRNGYKVDMSVFGSNMKRIADDGKEMGAQVHAGLQNEKAAKLVTPEDIGDYAIGTGYILGGMISAGVPSNPGFGEAAQFLVKDQDSDGHWGYGADRVPIQSSYFTTTALVLQIIDTYGDRQNLAPSIEKARTWLMNTPVRNSEDRAAKVLGLHWSRAPKSDIAKSAGELVAAQRPDGGWAPIDTLKSDAYATGMALSALRLSGAVGANDPVFQKGVQYLLRTQDEDGSWYVNKRAASLNVYFDAGFPHGESQYISFGATCWATMALLQAEEPAKTASR